MLKILIAFISGIIFTLGLHFWDLGTAWRPCCHPFRDWTWRESLLVKKGKLHILSAVRFATQWSFPFTNHS